MRTRDWILDSAWAAAFSRLAVIRHEYSAGARELTLMLGGLVLVELLLPGHASLASISPHPFWAVVLLMSVKYGFGSGVAACAAATLMGFVVGWPDRTSDGDFYDYYLQMAREPILWLVSAIILGGLASRKREECAELAEGLAQAEAQRLSIARQCERLQRHGETLERHVAGAADQSSSAAFTALAALRAAHHSELPVALTKTAQLLLGPLEASVYVVRHARLVEAEELRLGVRRADGVVRLPCIELADALARNPRVVTLLDDDASAALLEGKGIMASALTLAHGGRMVGLILVESMELERMTPAAGAALETLAAALSQALARQSGPIVLAAAQEARSSVMRPPAFTPLVKARAGGGGGGT